MDATGLPAVDGSQLTGVTSTDATKLAIANNLSDLNNVGTARTNLGLGSAAVLVAGTAANNAVQLDGSSRLPAVDGSQLTNLPSSTDTLDDVVGRGATTSTPITVGDLKINSDAAGSSTSGSIATLASNNNIKLDPHGSGVPELVGNATRGSGQLKFNCEQNSHGIILKGPPHSAAASYTMILPDGLGSTGQYLKLEDAGTGELSFDTPAGGGSRATVTSITAASYTIGTTDSAIGASELERVYTCSSSASTVNLPSSSGLTGFKLQIKNLLSSTITIDPDGSETIDTASTFDLSVQYSSVTLLSDGSNWIIV